uniref:Non-structural protein 2 n=1 Tax=Penaeus monodon hepatopancreatic parvovirus TaxID=182788 RepID=D5LTA0_9VIRU|nr:non-structural protein 2 [Penaeus monodon hepatopancreatic parvovirus]
MASKGDYYYSTPKDLVNFLVNTLLCHKISAIGMKMLTMKEKDFLRDVWLPYIQGFQTAHDLGRDECGAAGDDFQEVFFDAQKFIDFMSSFRRSVFISYGDKWRDDSSYFMADEFWSDNLRQFWMMIFGECFHINMSPCKRLYVDMLPYYYLAKMTTENRHLIEWEYMNPCPATHVRRNKMTGMNFCSQGVVIDNEYPDNQMGCYNIDEHPLPGGIRWSGNTEYRTGYVHVNKVKWLGVTDKVSDMEETSRDEEVPSSQEKYMKSKEKKEQQKTAEKKDDEPASKKRKFSLTNTVLEKQKMELGTFFRMEEEPINIKLYELEEGKEHHVHEAIRIDSSNSKFAKKKDEQGNVLDDFKVIVCDGENNLYGFFANTQLNKLFNKWHTTEKYSMKPEHNISLKVSQISEVRNGKMCVVKMGINDDVKCFAR